MQQCPDCGRVYDESDYAGCPYCDGYDDGIDHDNVIVYDREAGEAKVVPKSEAHLYE